MSVDFAGCAVAAGCAAAPAVAASSAFATEKEAVEIPATAAATNIFLNDIKKLLYCLIVEISKEECIEQEKPMSMGAEI